MGTCLCSGDLPSPALADLCASLRLRCLVHDVDDLHVVLGCPYVHGRRGGGLHGRLLTSVHG